MTTPQEIAAEQVFTIIANIPQGKVATYGQIARMAGMPNHARFVGRILSQLPDETSLPWHRIVNGQGRVTSPDPLRQINKLEEEGVTLFDGQINLKLYEWDP